MNRLVDENSVDLSLCLVGQGREYAVDEMLIEGRRIFVMRPRVVMLSMRFSRVSRNHVQLRPLIRAGDRFEIIVLHWGENYTEEEIRRLLPILSLSKSIISPRNEKDWECCCNYFGKTLSKIREIDDIVFRKRVGEDSFVSMILKKKIETGRLLFMTSTLFARLWAYDCINLAYDDVVAIPDYGLGEYDCLVCRMLTTEVKRDIIMKLGSEFHKVTLFVGSEKEHLRTLEDVTRVEGRYCGKVIDYGHLYTVCTWDPASEKKLKNVRIMRMCFRVIRDILLQVHDHLINDCLATATYFMREHDLGEFEDRAMYRILRILRGHGNEFNRHYC